MMEWINKLKISILMLFFSIIAFLTFTNIYSKICFIINIGLSLELIGTCYKAIQDKKNKVN